MNYIHEPFFSEEDIKILENLTEEKIQYYIDFLRGYRELCLRDGKDGKVFPETKIPEDYKFDYPVSVYPKKLKEMAYTCAIVEELEDPFNMLSREGFFDRDSITSAGVATL